MKNETETGRRWQSALTRKICLQYLLTLIVFIAAGALLVYLSVPVYRLLGLNERQSTRVFFLYLGQHSTVIIGTGAFVGWLLITWYFIRKPLRYLGEVTQSAAALAGHDSEPVVLSDDLKALQDDLNAVRETSMRNEALSREAEQRKNDLVVYLAHDLKTPLASVIGYLNLLKDTPDLPEELREKYLGITLTKADRLEELINEFFEIARFNLSDIPLQYGKINLTRLLEQLIFEFGPMLSEKHLTCRLEAAPDLTLRCDPDKLERAFDNLLRNAVIYSYENTKITVTVTVQGVNMIVTFLNHGDTIPKEKLERIFEQFYRVDSARSTSLGGSGLGLAIAKQIIEQHHGTITANSQDEWIRFRVNLPIN